MTVRVVSLFCGAGFADYALHRASEETGIPVEVVFACDSWDRAVMVYNANLPSRAVVADVKQLGREDLPAHDLVIGGPPCQPFTQAGERRGHADPRNCLPDFLRLSAGSAYLMENVRPRLIPQSWSEQYCAADFGDVTDRRRWFYSDHILHVIPTPGPRRIRDIRDREADVIENDVSEAVARKIPIESARQGQTYTFPTRGDGDFIGSLGGSSAHRLQSGSTLVAMPLAVHRRREDGGDPEVRYDTDFLPSLVNNQWHMINPAGEQGGSWRGLCRNVTLLEMQRAHSIPETWDWAGIGKAARAQMIANGWPIGMGSAVLSAMLRAVAATMEQAA